MNDIWWIVAIVVPQFIHTSLCPCLLPGDLMSFVHQNNKWGGSRAWEQKGVYILWTCLHLLILETSNYHVESLGQSAAGGQKYRSDCPLALVSSWPNSPHRARTLGILVPCYLTVDAQAPFFWSALSDNGSQKRTGLLQRKVAGALTLWKTGFS